MPDLEMLSAAVEACSSGGNREGAMHFLDQAIRLGFSPDDRMCQEVWNLTVPQRIIDQIRRENVAFETIYRTPERPERNTSLESHRHLLKPSISLFSKSETPQGGLHFITDSLRDKARGWENSRLRKNVVSGRECKDNITSSQKELLKVIL